MFLNKENKLDFACQSCGNCCKFFNINITHLDIQRILENRPDLKAEDFVSFSVSEKGDPESFISTYGKRQIDLKKKKDKDECVFLENNVCSIHSFKPIVCRVWPFSLEKNDKIDWIKEHKSFIKNKCAHTSIKGANDPEQLLTLLKQHDHERRLFEKLVKKWNSEKKSLHNSDDVFSEIYDQDFLNYLLQEIGLSENNNQSENLEKSIFNNDINDQQVFAGENKTIEVVDVKTNINHNILKVLSEDIRIELITESKISLLQAKGSDLLFDIYIKKSNLNSYIDKNNLNQIAAQIQSELFIYQEAANKISFFIDGIFLDLQIKSMYDLKNILNYDAQIIFNPKSYQLTKYNFLEQKKFELENIYQSFWFKMLKLSKLLDDNNLVDSKTLYNSIISQELLALVFWINHNDKNTQNNHQSIKELENFDNLLLNNSNDFRILSIQLIDIFQSKWQLTGLINNPETESIIRNRL